MSGTTAFPVAKDTFPTIGPNTPENGVGVEHDVVHENVHAAILALETKVGINASGDTASLDARMAAVEAGKIGANQRGIANGVCDLDASGLVPSSRLPSFVDDV